MQDNSVGDNRAAWLAVDMLGDKGMGNYRDLLQGVSTHPMMGYYLTFLQPEGRPGIGPRARPELRPRK